MEALEHGPGSYGMKVFDKVKMSDRAPTYHDPVIHFDALRFVALREGDTNEETLATENERAMPIRAPAHIHSAYTALRCWGKLSAHSQPAL